MEINVFLYIRNEQFKNSFFFYKISYRIQKNKILTNKILKRNATLAHRKLQNIVEINLKRSK